MRTRASEIATKYAILTVQEPFKQYLYVYVALPLHTFNSVLLCALALCSFSL